MYNINKPLRNELPSTSQLIRSTALAFVAAGAILVTIVLPSEYGIDPTGAGSALGLTKMGEIKMQLVQEAEAELRMVEQSVVSESLNVSQAEPKAPEIKLPVATVSPLQPAPSNEPASRNDELSITLSPGEGVEVKLAMIAGAQTQYEWTANGSVLNFDAHGDGGGQSISYAKGRGVAEDKGVLEAAFDGNHGWYWRNRTTTNVTMTLRTQGEYSDLKK